MKGLPALPEPVEDTKLKIPWGRSIITAVAWAFLWGFIQENKGTLRDRISRLGFWSDVHWAYFKARLKYGYYWLCLNGPGVYSWLPEPKNNPDFEEYKRSQWLAKPATPTNVYSSVPLVDPNVWHPHAYARTRTFLEEIYRHPDIVHWVLAPTFPDVD
jgi:hypothetical protein